MSEAAALAVLALSLAAAVLRAPAVPDWLVAPSGALLLVVLGVSSWGSVRAELRELDPTVGFLAALLALAEGCRRAGMFEALGAALAAGARSATAGRRLLAMVFLVAAATTAVLSLDATVVLLTPSCSPPLAVCGLTPVPPRTLAHIWPTALRCCSRCRT